MAAGSATADPDVLARTAREYDAIPYLSKPFAESHPARMAGAARLLGLDPPAVGTARVLELGGASGGNLIPFAAYHPQAQCTVIDIGPRQVAEGQARIAALGLPNIDIRCASITDLDETLGPFDYVIAHGVYSWVSAPVREALMSLMGRLLAPRGVAYLSYNVLPGWRMAQPARDAIRALVPASLPEADRVRMARDLLWLATRHAINTEAYGKQLRETCERLLARPDDFLFHDFMEHENEPFLFGDVIAQADRHGLAFLAEADLCSCFDENFGTEFQQEIRQRTGGEALPREAVFDVLSGRTFRQTYLVGMEQAARIERNTEPRRLDQLHLLVARGAKIEVSGQEAKMANPHGLQFGVTGQVFTNLAHRLLGASPGSLSVADALRGVPDAERPLALRMLLRLVTSGVLLPVDAPMRTGKASIRPVAAALARLDVRTGNQRTTNPRHESIWLEPEFTVMLPLMDGTADAPALMAALSEAAMAGRIDPPPGIAANDPAALEAAYREMLPEWIDGLATMGLLASSSPER